MDWTRSAPRAAWSGVLDATKIAPACAQGDTGWTKSFMTTMREDCLTVSIRTPAATKTKARLPVLVYLHGGSNAYAGAGDMAEDALHREGIVLVKVQYRLGAWGFLGRDSLAATSTVALDWVMEYTGWLFMVLASLFVVFVLWLALGKWGNIPLGKDGERPEFRTVSWIAMMFAVNTM